MSLACIAEPKRFFRVFFGIDYTVVARDEAHALEIVREADADFDETIAEDGEPVFVEISADDAHTQMIYDDGIGSPLASFPLGTYASSEF